MLAGLSPDQRLAWAVESFGRGLVLVTSFGPSGMVMLDHVARLAPELDVVTLDTGFLFPESYALLEAAQRRCPQLRFIVQRPQYNPEEQEQKFGPRLWERDPDLCCFVRKVAPLAEALRGRSAWISGLRRDQSAGRAATPLLRWDEQHQMPKLSPLADWTENEVWAYIRRHRLPYNALHDRGYPSIGCTHCTRAVRPGEEARAGRWAGRAKTECGLHVGPQHLPR